MKKQQLENIIGHQCWPKAPEYEEVAIVMELARESLARDARKRGCISTGDIEFAEMMLYTLGRIHGIREERAHRRSGKGARK